MHNCILPIFCYVHGTLDLKFSEMLNTAWICVSNLEKLLSGTLKQSDIPKLHFCPYLVIWSPWSLTVKFSEILPHVGLFQWQKLPPDTFEWSYRFKTVILPIFGQVVNLAFELWNPKSNQFIFISLSILPQNLIEWETSLPNSSPEGSTTLSGHKNSRACSSIGICYC